MPFWDVMKFILISAAALATLCGALYLLFHLTENVYQESLKELNDSDPESIDR